MTDKSSKSRKNTTPAAEDKTILQVEDDATEVSIAEKTELIKEEEDESEGTIIAGDGDANETKLEGDALVDELLSDDDVEMSGM